MVHGVQVDTACIRATCILGVNAALYPLLLLLLLLACTVELICRTPDIPVKLRENYLFTCSVTRGWRT